MFLKYSLLTFSRDIHKLLTIFLIVLLVFMYSLVKKSRSFLIKKLTCKYGAKFFPTGDPTLRGELAECHLQEEHRQSSTEQENEVWDEKST